MISFLWYVHVCYLISCLWHHKWKWYHYSHEHTGECNHIFEKKMHVLWKISKLLWHDTLRPRQNGCHFPNNMFKCIFLNENVWISLKISFMRKVRMSHIPALVQIMAWRRPGNELLSEPMVVSLLMLICVMGPQWVNSVWLSHMAGHCSYWHHMVLTKQPHSSPSQKAMGYL